MTKIMIDDLEMYYEIHGEGFPLIMIQGYNGTTESWDTLVPRLSDLSKRFRAIVIDNRGTGRSSAPEGEYSINTMVKDVVGLLDALKIREAHILGVSMGGMIAQELAINHPERVKNLVLTCTFPGGHTLDSIPGQRAALEKNAWLYSPPPGVTQEAVREQMLRMVYRPKFLEENRAKILSASVKYPTSSSTLEKHFDVILKFNTYSRLGRIRSKTLIIHGEDDELVMPEGGEILARLIPNSRLLMCKEASHCVLEEKWSEVKPVILDHLSEPCLESIGSVF
ncbi:MAG: alpha/beta hydrolase [Candidatus Bathyarchaeia archaeon]